jgi:hypothetical protein
MSLIDSIRGFFGKPTPPILPPPLRNKPGGMALIKGNTNIPQLNGRIVKTVRIESEDRWFIDPVQVVSNLPAGLVFVDGKTSRGGERGDVTAVADRCLQPLSDPGDEAVDETLLWLPVPTKKGEPA